MTEVSPSSSSAGLDEWNGVPLGRRYDSVKASTFRSVQPAEDRAFSPLGPRDYNTRPNGQFELENQFPRGALAFLQALSKCETRRTFFGASLSQSQENTC